MTAPFAPRRLTIATRESALALWQAEHVRAQLVAHYRGISVELLGVTTQGDRFGASLTETARWVHGAWRPRGEYASLTEDERRAALGLTLLAG